MVDSEAMQNRRLNIVNMNGVFDDIKAEVIRFAKGEALLKASAGKPHGVCRWVVITPLGAS
jgi:hypothetical protein